MNAPGISKVSVQTGTSHGGVPLPDGTRLTGTVTRFTADTEMFPVIEWDIAVIEQWLRETAYLNKGLFLTLRDERNDTAVNYYFDGGIMSFVRHLNRSHEALHAKPVYVEKPLARSEEDGRAIVRVDIANFSCLKTYDPPLDALVGVTITGCGRRGCTRQFSRPHPSPGGWPPVKRSADTDGTGSTM